MTTAMVDSRGRPATTPEGVRGNRSLVRDLAEGVRNPEFWALSAWLDIVITYRRSRLGVFWLLLPSIVYIGGVGALFAGLFGRHYSVFAAHLALGWVVFHVTSSVTSESTTVLYQARSFILDGRMRLSDFVLRSMAKACFYLLMALPMTAVALFLYPSLHVSGVLLGLAAFPLVLINTLWAGVVFALAGARFPDMHQFISNIFRLLFLLTPIVWYPDQMPPHSMRSIVARMNPFYHLIEIVRAPFLGEPIGMQSWLYMGVMTVLGCTLAIVLYRRYARLVPIWL